MKGKSMSEKLSLIGAGIGTVTLVIFCIYGLVYDYMDIAVAFSLVLSVACGAGYVLLHAKAVEVLNLLQVMCVSWGMGLFFLNSYPVWADRLNGIDMDREARCCRLLPFSYCALQRRLSGLFPAL